MVTLLMISSCKHLFIVRRVVWNVNVWTTIKDCKFIIRRSTTNRSISPSTYKKRQRNTTKILRGIGCQFSIIAEEIINDT